MRIRLQHDIGSRMIGVEFEGAGTNRMQVQILRRVARFAPLRFGHDVDCGQVIDQLGERRLEPKNHRVAMPGHRSQMGPEVVGVERGIF